MTSLEIDRFRKRIAKDRENLLARRSFHEQYEWLEAFWQHRYGGKNHVSRFAQEFESFFWAIPDFRALTGELSAYTPVGSSNNNFDPTKSVRRATFFLRHHCGLYEYDFPDDGGESELGLEWKKSPFEAILTIMKQVRDNLFHGRKMDLEDDKYRRNKELVTMSSNITKAILDKLTEAEQSLR